MVNVNRWYFEKTATISNTFRTQIDPFDPAGGNLLERTVIPMVTEVGDASHNRNGHAALIFGGTKLGMQGGQFNRQRARTISSGRRSRRPSSGRTPSLLASEAYSKSGANPLSGLWAAPT